MKIKLSEILQDTKTVAISGHIRPDGDCVGSISDVTRLLDILAGA